MIKAAMAACSPWEHSRREAVRWRVAVYLSLVVYPV